MNSHRLTAFGNKGCSVLTATESGFHRATYVQNPLIFLQFSGSFGHPSRYSALDATQSCWLAWKQENQYEHRRQCLIIKRYRFVVALIFSIGKQLILCSCNRFRNIFLASFWQFPAFMEPDFPNLSVTIRKFQMTIWKESKQANSMNRPLGFCWPITSKVRYLLLQSTHHL